MTSVTRSLLLLLAVAAAAVAAAAAAAAGAGGAGDATKARERVEEATERVQRDARRTTNALEDVLDAIDAGLRQRERLMAWAPEGGAPALLDGDGAPLCAPLQAVCGGLRSASAARKLGTLADHWAGAVRKDRDVAGSDVFCWRFVAARGRADAKQLARVQKKKGGDRAALRRAREQAPLALRLLGCLQRPDGGGRAHAVERRCVSLDVGPGDLDEPGHYLAFVSSGADAVGGELPADAGAFLRTVAARGSFGVERCKEEDGSLVRCWKEDARRFSCGSKKRRRAKKRTEL